MNTETYHCRLNQLHRKDVQRAVRRQELLRLAAERRPKTMQAYTSLSLPSEMGRLRGGI